MVDTDRLLELVPHYVAMLAIVIGVIAVLRTAVGYSGFWVEVAVVTVIVFLYRPVVKRLGVAPSLWE